MNKAQNLFKNIPFLVEGEEFLELLKCRNIAIERIVSSDKPDNKIYKQLQDEWVILIRGEATLKINDDVINLKAGDYVFIQAQTPHQVLTTSNNCLWLAIHIYP
ncbi:cupin domain-containing protein [Cyanobacterium aponinum FACHB-4101]|uniref:cupin domain-containing protein n=1 Tax=Cyanobacterium aponinum TaxID=379064 RepID=UPI00168141BA|nr:cupin domain-containing protein [Cyanobacterium aponinum]MBD2393684.1 cupin domain-containing protein [Cyanobacterium aponinum FACHB-4101]